LEASSANPQAGEDLRARLSLVEQLLSSDPARADAQAAELLAIAPGHPMALLFQGIARRLLGNAASAVEILSPLCQRWPDAPLAHLQLGLALRATGANGLAVQTLRRAVAIKTDFSDAWLALADLLTAMGDVAGADLAFATYIRHSARDPSLAEPAQALRENRTADAEALLRRHLERHPNDVVALCMLADVAVRHGRVATAETLLKACLQLAPSYRLARHNYAVALMRLDRPGDALREADRLLAEEPDNAAFRNLRGAICMQMAEYEEAAKSFEQVLQQHPEQPRVWASLGHVLRTIGRRDECIAAYRKAIALAPEFGEAYWNLANLKTLGIGDPELEAMRAQLERADLGADDRVHFHFAIGKALEERCAFEESFRHYAEGNRLRRQALRYNPDDLTELVRRSKALFTQEFFAERSGWGTESSGPIFIVGLPRAGSTLVEQILASHSAVEGTMELPHITGIAKSLAERAGGPRNYPEALAALKHEEFRERGNAYLEGTRAQRKRGTPFFLDKMPNNFAHLGLIHLILPNARIVDVRRHPLACGFSLFKHLFAHGQNFSYTLEDIARYYREYVELMVHFDAVVPGRVYRVVYESLVADTEAEVRRLLDYCGLPFEPACLSFYENKRAVSTPSSEQVRRPIFREALEHWRHYEPWLGPLKAQLGALADG
jgi:tetratricopeptide (TPR) repeat protein